MCDIVVIVSQVTQHPLQCVLFTEAVIKVHSDSRGGDADRTALLEESRSPLARRA